MVIIILHNVMLVLSRKLIAQTLTHAIREKPDMDSFIEYSYENAAITAGIRSPEVTLVEIPERPGHPEREILKICAKIRSSSPGSKIVLLCPEDSGGSISAVVTAKQAGEIDDFIFYDASLVYLTAKLESLCSEQN